MASRAPLPPPPAPPFAFIPSMEQLRVPELINSVREVESGSRENRTSRKGALGPMQVMPETLKNPGYGMAPATDYSQSGLDRFGQEYLQRMIQHYGDVRDALVAYNWGPGNANNWIRRGRKEAALPRETREYLKKVGLDYAQRVKDETSPPVQTAAAPLPPPPAPPVQTAAVPAPAPAPAPAPDTASPVPPPAAPDEPAQDWMASAFYGPTLSRAEGREDRRADDALSLFQTAQRFLSPGPRTVAQRGSYAEGGAVRVPEGEPDETASGVGSLAGRARAMFEVEPLDYRPAARGARAAAERLGEELSAPGRVPAPDVRQQLERMARDALEAGKVAGEVGYELLVPQDLTDVALMALMGPGARVGGKVLRRGVGATLMALDPEEVVSEESAVKNYANGGEVHSGVGSLAPAARNMTRRTA